MERVHDFDGVWSGYMRSSIRASLKHLGTSATKYGFVLYSRYLALVSMSIFAVAIIAIFSDEIGVQVRTTDENVVLLGLAAVLPLLPSVNRLKLGEFLTLERASRTSEEAASLGTILRVEFVEHARALAAQRAREGTDRRSPAESAPRQPDAPGAEGEDTSV